MSKNNTNDSEIRLHALDYWQVLRNRYAIVLLAFFLVFMTATVITYMMPKEYLGRVSVQINKESKPEIDQPSRNSDPFQAFMQTEFAIIESKENLDRVAEELNLLSKWNLSSPQEVYSRLLRKIRVQEQRGTKIVNIEAYDPDPDIAAALANHVAECYKNRREELDRDQMNHKIAELEVQAKKQDGLMAKAQQEMFRLQKEGGFTDLGMTPYLHRDSINNAQGDIVKITKLSVHEMEGEISKIRTTINTLTSLDGKQLIPAAVELGIQSQTLSDRYPQYQSEKIMRDELTGEGLGRMHPKILSIDQKLVTLERMLVEAVEISKRALATQMQMKELELEAMKTLKGDAEDELMADKQSGVGFVAVRDEYHLRKNLLEELNQRIALARVDDGFSQHPIRIHGRAEPPLSPAKPNVNLQLAIGAIMGLAFGIGLAFFLEYLDTSVKSLEDVERYLQVPVLAVIPRDVGVLHQQSGMSPDAEAYRILRTNIEFNRKSADANSITVVSGGAGEGKSTTLVNLAYICAQGGYNTLMIDGDLRRPKLHTFFDINNSVGLTNYLTTELELEDVILQTPVDNLFFMPSGILPADAAGILNSRRMSELITEVKSRFDLVLIDSPPILGVSDASVLASEVDLTMIVIQHRKLPRSMLVRVKEAVENVGGNLLGVVLNNVDVRSDSQYQYYTSYYTYYAPTQSQASRPASPPVAAADQALVDSEF